MFHCDRKNGHCPQERTRVQGVLVRADKLIQNPSDNARQVMRVVLVCPLADGEAKDEEPWLAESGLRVVKHLP